MRLLENVYLGEIDFFFLIAIKTLFYFDLGDREKAGVE